MTNNKRAEDKPMTNNKRAEDEPMTNNKRAFPIDDILAVLTGRFVSERGFEAFYDLLGFLFGERPFTHQISRFCEICSRTPRTWRAPPNRPRRVLPQNGPRGSRDSCRSHRTLVATQGGRSLETRYSTRGRSWP